MRYVPQTGALPHDHAAPPGAHSSFRTCYRPQGYQTPSKRSFEYFARPCVWMLKAWHGWKVFETVHVSAAAARRCMYRWYSTGIASFG